MEEDVRADGEAAVLAEEAHGLVAALHRDLIGPMDTDPQDEIITDPPITRYVAGILYPLDDEIDPAQDFGDDDD